MNIVFLTCYYDHHQSELSDALYTLTQHNFRLVETDELEEERLRMGWSKENSPPYVMQYASQKSEVEKLIIDADVVIWGSSPVHLIKRRLKAGKLTFRYSERIFKKSASGPQFWGRAIKYNIECRPNKNLHLLSAGAYAASDYMRIKAINDAYVWGYFPPFQKIDAQHKSINQEIKLLWAGRMISWKHPEFALEIAELLKKQGHKFELNIIGNGVLESQIHSYIQNKKLQDCVHVLGSMPPEKVREYMTGSDVFLFTSDRNEGWGAVLNEAMNSKCAVVACDAIGAVPYMLKTGENGLLYKENSFNDFASQVEFLFNYPNKIIELGEAAYITVSEKWNANVAAERLLTLIDCIDQGEAVPFKDGPCSKAPILYC